MGSALADPPEEHGENTARGARRCYRGELTRKRQTRRCFCFSDYLSAVPLRLDQAVALVTLVVTAYGISDEFHQGFVPGRDASTLDALANFIGGLGAATSVVWWQRRPWG